MKKLTFKDFLIEFDSGDFALAATAKADKEKTSVDTHTKDAFQQKMSGNSPSVGDVIKTNSGLYAVIKMDRSGLHVKHQENNKVIVVPHGTKFTDSGKKSPIGDNKMFLLRK